MPVTVMIVLLLCRGQSLVCIPVSTQPVVACTAGAAYDTSCHIKYKLYNSIQSIQVVSTATAIALKVCAVHSRTVWSCNKEECHYIADAKLDVPV
jgi:hypothetical protein